LNISLLIIGLPAQSFYAFTQMEASGLGTNHAIRLNLATRFQFHIHSDEEVMLANALRRTLLGCGHSGSPQRPTSLIFMEILFNKLPHLTFRRIPGAFSNSPLPTGKTLEIPLPTLTCHGRLQRGNSHITDM
jgi:hypothetical protein